MAPQQGPDSQPDTEQVRLRAIVHGHVQGVSFRYYALRAAERLHLTGWVANRWDGTVETVAEGNRVALDEFHALLEQGPPGAFVERVDVEWLPASAQFSPFRVRLI